MAEASDKPLPPIIIKKIKKGGHGHHGGAWKVAYADFVTAMMAFFLLLWLLAVTSEEQKKGIADYFTPTTGVKDAKGIGFQGGKSPNTPGSKQSDASDPGLVVGQVPQGPVVGEPKPKEDTPPVDDASGAPAPDAVVKQEDESKPDVEANTGTPEQDKKEEEQMKKVEEDIFNAFEQTPELKELKKNIIISHTPEGLKIDMVDDQNRPMFAPGSALITDTGKLVMQTVGEILTKTDNKIAIAGNTDAAAQNVNSSYTNWELSADRANSSRRYMVQNVIEYERVEKVTGMADQDLLVENEPNSPRNRRISLTLLRGTEVKKPRSVNPGKGLLSVPTVAPKKEEPPAAEIQADSPDAAKQQEILEQKVPSLFTPTAPQ